MKAYTVPTGLSGLSDLIHTEIDPTYTTDRKTLLAGSGGTRTLAQFALAAAVLLGAPTVTPGAVVGTGNGAIGVVTADAGAQAGDYQVVIIEPASNGGAFQVFRPDGVLDGAGNIGVAYNGMINFTLADGATDFVAGDRIPVEVEYAAGSGKIVQWDPDAVNGAQTIVGINLWEAEAADGVDGECTLLARGPAIIRREAIAFHDGATDDEKTEAYRQLEALGIQCRVSG